MTVRDLVGYGGNPPRVAWPNGARLAVSLVLNYEEGAERSILDGDPDHEVVSEVPSPVPTGQRDLAVESMYEYGSRAGVWRVLSLADRYQAPLTFYLSALALERNPALAGVIAARDDEVCGHGYRWEEYYRMDRETEREAIARAVASIERTTGRRPRGWYVRYGPSEHTRALLAEEGGFEYDSNAYNDDLPYYVTVQGRPWLVVPYSLHTNDTRFWRGGLVSAGDFYECLRDSFDFLYAEGAASPKMLSIGLHCRIVGRPDRALALEKFLRHARSFPAVWFARRIDIARWWREHYPPPAPGH
ncbi:MAG: polysaccharide deacetylase family protein [Chloroflexi bacterium]|nr:polysaccharide deacetylase family protein [Chloroflexota bacterium]